MSLTEKENEFSNVPKKNWWRRVLETFNINFLKKKSSPQLDNYYNDFNEMVIQDQSLELEDDILHLQGVNVDGQNFLKLGINDGKSAIKTESVGEIARTRASIWQVKIERYYRQKFEKLNTQLSHLAGRKIIVESETTQFKSEYEQIDEHYRHNRKIYNRKLGFAYVIISLILVFADFPLSLKVAKEAYKLNPTEQYIFAAGLALMTVFFKIVYDQYLGNSASQYLLQQRPEIMIGKGLKSADEREVKTYHKINSRHFWVKITILILLITTIIFIGIFRMESEAAVSTLKSLMPTTGAKIVTPPSSSLIGKISFICISVAFPLIGGISASVGFNYLANASILKNVNIKLTKIKDKKINLEGEIELTKSELANVNTVLNWVNSESNFLIEKSKYFEACYMHGYRRAVSEINTTDFYEAAKKARNTSFIKKATELYSI